MTLSAEQLLAFAEGIEHDSDHALELVVHPDDLPADFQWPESSRVGLAISENTGAKGEPMVICTSCAPVPLDS